MFFSYDGRINRAKFFGYNILLSAVSGIISFIINSLIQNSVGLMLSGIVGVASLYPMACLYIKRSHDLNKSGSFILLCLIPLVNLYPSIVLTFVKGTDGPNQYGEDPLSLTDTQY
ncbi:MAG: DUF805 domain-containing protein [Anaeromicrobium sp.]|uniref:DUF805 domain-containing protein n=1 Tax=Anaeromicrobium sp. TaxID=1929132 RepID=UPI0025D7F85C|nr:DUF805 domain-containing protein [Anaeromicrobium sp.]MCT4594041.1 DUF805 domain-containing protein [Anaeromicrobium sp.]